MRLACQLPVLVIVAAAAAAAGAPAGEPEAVPPPFLYTAKWRHAQAYAQRAALVVTARVTEAGKPSGAGWKDDNEEFGSRVGWASVDLRQEVKLEVTAVLRGKEAPKTLAAKLGRIRVNGEDLPDGEAFDAGYFAVRKDSEYIFFFEDPAKTADGGWGALHVEKAGPIALPDAALVASVRDFCIALADWDRAPAATEEEAAAVAGHIEALASGDQARAAQAQFALRNMGMKARGPLEAAAKDADAGKAAAAETGLKLIRPEAGAVEHPVSPSNPTPDTSFYYAPLADRLLREKAFEAKLVVVARVRAAGPTAGRGWDPSNETSPESKTVRMSEVSVGQDAEVEVTEVLCGKLDAAKLKLRVGTMGLRHWHLREYFFSLNPRPMGFGLPCSYFALRDGESYILCLDGAAPGGDKDAEASATLLTGTWPLAVSPAALATFRDWSRSAAAWVNPGQRTPEEEAAAARHIEALDSDKFDEREAAEEALRAMGARARSLLEKAANDKAFERARRAADIMEDLRPEPGKTLVPWTDGKELYAGVPWSVAQIAAFDAPLVVIGKVVEPGRIAGSGWQYKPNEAPVDPAAGEDAIANTLEVDLRQSSRVEVVSVLRGSFEGRELTVRLDRLRVEQEKLQPLYMRRRAHAPDYQDMKLPARYFSLMKGETCIFFLAAPDAGGTATHLATFHPAREPSADVIASVTRFCRLLNDWQNPAKLSAEEEAAAKALVNDLSSENYATREAAEAKLKAIGGRAGEVLRAAAKDADLERAERAQAILEALTPRPGEVEMPGAEQAAPEPEPTPAKGGARARDAGPRD